MTLKRYNVGVVKIPYEDRDVVHDVLQADDDRGFLDVIGSATDDDDDDFPIGSNTTYSMLLTEEEAAEFAEASNIRYIEEERKCYPMAVAGKLYPMTFGLEMRDAMRMTDPAVALWHGKDVPLGICDSGVSPWVVEALGLTVAGRQIFGGEPLDEFETQGSHGSAVTSIMSPYGGVIYDALAIGTDGSFDNYGAAIRWVADQGVKVVNFSGGSANPNNEQPDQFFKDLAAYMAARGVVWSVPAGNEGYDHLEIPGALSKTYSNVASMGSWGLYNNALWDDNPGGGSSHESAMTCVIPSGARFNLCLENTPLQVNHEAGGTSLATPMMGHLIARICTGGRFTAMEALTALKATMRDLGVARSIQGGGMPDLKAALTFLGAFNDSATFTNLSPNPCCGSDTTGWVTTGSGTRKTDLNQQLFPRGTGFQTTKDVDSPKCTVASGSTYTHSATIRMSSEVPNVGIGIRWYNSGGSVISTGSIRALGSWPAGGIGRVTVTGTAPSGAVASALTIDDTSDTATIHITGHLCIAGSTDKNYFDGSSGGTLVQAAWTGSAQNSTSTVKYKTMSQPTRYNLCPNPSFENNLTGWEIGNLKSGATATLGRKTGAVSVNQPASPFGTSMMWILTTNNEYNADPVADFNLRSPFCDVTAGEVYTASMHLRGHSAEKPYIDMTIEWYNSSNALVSVSGNIDQNWTLGYHELNRFWVAGTAPVGTTKARIKLGYYGQMNNVSNINESLDVDGVLFEKGFGPNPLFDGSSPTAAWTGAAGNSTSYLGTPTGGGGGDPGGGGGSSAVSGQIQQYGYISIVDNGTTISLEFKGYDSNNTQRVSDSITFNVPAATPVTPPAIVPSASLKVTAHLAENGSTGHDYFDGDSSGGSWTGQSGNSTSTIGGAPTPYRKNLCPNPSFENNTTGYSITTRSGITASSIGRSSAIVPVLLGSNYMFVNITGNGTTNAVPDFEITLPDAEVQQGLTYFFSTTARHTIAGTEMEIAVEWRTATGTISTTVGARETVQTNEWDRMWMTASAPTNATIARMKIRGYNHTDTGSRSFRLDGVLIEQANDRVEYFDGSSTGGTWTGTPGNSTSYLGTPPSDGGGTLPEGNFLYRKAYEGFLNGLIDWDTGTIRAALVRGYTKDTAHTFMSDVTGAGGAVVVATTGAFTGKTVTNGQAGAATASFGTVAVGAPIPAVVVYQSSAPAGGSDVSASAQRIIAYLDTGQNFPITPNGGSISLQFSTRIFEL